MTVWIIKCRKCGSYEVFRYGQIISCLDCGCIFVLGNGPMIYDPKAAAL